MTRTPFLLALLLSVTTAFAGVELLKNVNSVPISRSSFPFFLGSIGDAAIFAADTAAQDSRPLWRTDGTTSGTVILHGVQPEGTHTSSAGSLSINDYVVFVGTGPGQPPAIWSTDGTTAGTQPIIDYGNRLVPLGVISTSEAVFVIVFATPRPSEIWVTDGTRAGSRLVNSGGVFVDLLQFATHGRVFFAGADVATGLELWQSDGTSAGTRPIADVEPGTGSSQPRIIGVAGDFLYFQAETTALGSEPHRLNLATGEVSLFGDFEPGPFGSDIRDVHPVPGGLVFAHNSNLWVSDGTFSGSRQLMDFDPIADPDPVFVLGRSGNRVISTAPSPTAGRELWSTDGTVAGTAMLRDFSPGPADTDIFIHAVVDGQLLFQTLTIGQMNQQPALWMTDGTVPNTRNVFPAVGSGPMLGILAFPVSTYALLYVSEATSHVAYRVDAATATATVIGPIARISNPGVVARDRYYFGGGDTASGVEPWVSDGTTSGSRMILDIVGQLQNESADVRELVRAGGRVFFVANDRVHGYELWSTDGTTSGTQLVADIRPGEESSLPRLLRTAGDIVYFQAEDGQTGLELWRSDGTAAGTWQVKDINPGGGWAFSSSQTPCETWLAGSPQRIYFAANDGISGEELWTSDGATSGTRLVKDLRAGGDFSGVCDLLVVDGIAYFTANDGTTGAEPHRSDGTSAGTILLADVFPGVRSSFVREFFAFRDRVYFIADRADNSPALWRTDGSASAALFFDGGSQSVFPSRIVGAAGSSLVVSMFGAANGLYGTDGVTPPSRFWSTREAVSRGGTIGNRLLFRCGVENEICVTDGTTDGSSVVQNLAPGNQAGIATDPVGVNGVAFLVATDPVLRAQIWKSDGTTTGTSRISDFPPIAGDAVRMSPVVAGVTPVFAAYDTENGLELWAIKSTAPTALDDAASAASGGAVLIDVLANDTDPDGRINRLSVRIVAGPTNGSVAIDPSGSLRYTPAAAFSGSDSFRYAVSDDFGFESNAANVTVTVAGQPPGGGNGGGGGGGSVFLELAALLLSLAYQLMRALCVFTACTRSVR